MKNTPHHRCFANENINIKKKLAKISISNYDDDEDNDDCCCRRRQCCC